MATAPTPVPRFSERLWSDEVGMIAGPDEGAFRGYEFSNGRSFVALMAKPEPDTEPVPPA